ncbi:hypothetical protein BKA70DRAFT_1556875 [Coprinopsis sp. MPI-PUGE-AT-0042]|nr:hypothetical protein BKA70DRAFT_1556875 [Coprinopsis sp. MPI-PUGE-AT-0042]
MSFLKRLRRKVGGRQSEHGEGADGDLQEGADETEARKSQELGTNEADDIRTGVVPQAGSDKGQIVNISGGTFTEIQNQTNIQYVMSDESESKLFAMLNPVAAAHDCQEVASKVKECFAGTRCQLLLDMENWRANESSVPIFILDGIAGIGKTTVVKTFCTRAASEHRLAASWFFSRDRQDRKSTRRFVGTLAYQLALYHPAFGDRVAHALKDHPDILQKTIRAQFDTLIHEPLEAVLKELDGTHAISIDAIDECDLDEATEILSILLGTVPKHPQLRFLISCRPERPFRLLLQRHRGPHVFHLHEIENSVVESDIRLYIDYRLSPEQVDDALPDLLPPPWRASAKEKEALVQMAGKLFIIASTAVNFILDPRRLAPARQMRQLLDATTGSALASSPMDRLYTQVLRAAVPDPVDDWFDDYQAVVGAIVVAADVLPVQSLASLLGKEPNSIVGTLSHLHALVAPTSQSHNEAFRVHHKSFPDFVTDPSRCSIDTRFLIDASACHAHLARGCLRVMVQMLKQNICELPFLDWSKRLNELPPGIVDRIAPELAYACTHWVSHFQQGLSHFSGSKDTLFCDQLNTFVNEHLLSWLEVMAFTGRFNTAWESVNVLSEAILLFLQTATGSTLATLSHVAHVLQDCLHFINLHPDLPRLCPMHIYLSSLPFAPIGSPMGRLYAKCKSKEPVNAVLGVDWNWDSLAVVIESYNTVDLRFSPCGAMIAILTHSLALYDAKSGGLIRRFYSPEIPLPRFCCLAFSADGHLVVVGSATRAYVWKVASGELIAKFLVPITTREASDNDGGNEGEGEDGNSDDQVPITSIAFTGDCASIVAGREDGVLFLWSLEGSEVPQHVVHTRKLNEACGCPSDGFLETCEVHHVEDLIALPTPLSMISVTGSDVQFWDPSPPYSLINIPRHVHGTRPCPVSLPLNKTMLAIQSNPCAIDIYSTSRPRCIAVLSGHRGLVTTTAFSPEGENLCSASEDMTVRLWNVPTATQLRIIPTTPSILRDAIFAKPVGTIFRNADRMVMLTGIECTPFGTTTTRGYSNHLVRLSPGGSTIAIHTFPFRIFSSLNELTASSSDFNDFPYMTGFFPTGELVTRWNKEPGFVEVVITELKGGTQVASASFKIKGSSFITSPDKTRMAVIGASSSVSVYNLHSKT